MSGGDALKLLNTTTIMADDEKDKESCCPRCNGKVFHNERVQVSGGRVYHKKCATCATCEKNIGTKDIHIGKDRDIFCKSCNARKFGATEKKEHETDALMTKSTAKVVTKGATAP